MCQSWHWQCIGCVLQRHVLAGLQACDLNEEDHDKILEGDEGLCKK